MTKKVPYNNAFKSVETNERVGNALLVLSVIVSAATIIIDKGVINIEKALPLFYLNSINTFLAIAYFVSDVTSNYLFQKAEKFRRDDLFDNSLNMTLSTENSQSYFSNDSISAGVKKLGVNAFENSFFTMSISDKMFRKMLIKSGMISLLMLAISIFTSHDYWIFFLQLVLPLTIIQKTIRLGIYNHRVGCIYNRFRHIFSTTIEADRPNLIILAMTDYECNQSWACIKLDSKIFEELNPSLSAQWNTIKGKYNLI
ncbi:MAG: hypothetical protein JST76_07315 [Bacteroidetes bacterium]|nr:hypothetical protein [Bacteroidota bacterium]